ncbi:MerR family transcriptional regulator [Streptomyces clavifer]|uniref:DNA-binding transcriptional MerR regulator n=1 Tax=Streptomyces clavifer TaxID=68188 RepID=A0ABS4V3R6_9ACTN|nr:MULTISPECIES: MerR family transcriptional regulator [Streptomyces]MBP2358559.1 DNA-binding transcriptional MerR regulator [Streptomyces clavifer]MDX2746902.1 MerR family transcriptional regulator [Streptomyces sp. NRRL_B-2557]MDX3066991.1 MerR family transcriptional regulator [Streptomyces sp. ND04-05B]
MAWSTRQLAELAGTTTKAVRHYHEIGLLDEPERASNGYKRYGVSHLVRLLRIRRLTDLGVALADVPSVESGDEKARQVLRGLDAELAADIERRQRMRRELAAVMENRAALDMPQHFRTLADDLPETQRSLLMAYSSILTPVAMAALQEQLAGPRGDLDAEFAALEEDASDEVRQRLAERMVPDVRQQHRDHPGLADLASSSHRETAVAESVVVHALVEYYNRAHLDVLQRVHAILSEDDTTESESNDARGSAGVPVSGRGPLGPSPHSIPPGAA